MIKSHLKARVARTSLEVLDVFLVVWLVVYLWNFGHPIEPGEAPFMKLSLSQLLALPIIAIIWHFFFLFSGLYQFRSLEGWQKSFGRLLLACTLSVGSTYLVGNISSMSVASWSVFPLRLWFWSVIVFSLDRAIVFFILYLVRRWGRNLLNVVIVGLNHRSLSLFQKLGGPGAGFYFHGFFDAARTGAQLLTAPNLRFLGPLDQFPAYISQNPIDQVLLALPIRSHYDEIARIINTCAIQGIQTWLLTDLFNLPPKTAFRIDHFWETFFINYYTDPRSEFHYELKRLIDILLSGLALIALSPVFLLLALLILFDDGRPIFFAQERVGLNKRRFKMFKFRTMVRDAERLQAELEARNEANGAVFKISDDPRITRFGRFLRRTSLDEIPQFLNVFLGSMSLVGPRPLPIRDFERFYDDSHRLRFSIKPGITGMWQVSGRSNVEFEEWMKLDTFYVHNWSLLLDLRILLRTVKVVCSSSGAY